MEEAIARAFHETYERLAPNHGYETREASAKPWEEVPENNRELMKGVVKELLEKDFIRAGGALSLPPGASYSQPETMQPRMDDLSRQMDEAARERSGQKE